MSQRSLTTLKKDGLVRGFGYDSSHVIDFCEPCIGGKIHRNPFPKSGRERAKEPLELVHSDVCGKISSPSLGQAEYFVTFIDDKTHYTWVYVMKHKSEVFEKFMEWKAFVEKSSSYKVKKLRTDNGGEYVSTEFEGYLKEPIHHCQDSRAKWCIRKNEQDAHGNSSFDARRFKATTQVLG